MPEPPTAREAHLPLDQRKVDAVSTDAGGLLALARRVAAGDDGALGELYEARFDHVFLAARRATGGGDESLCLDVVQECFVRVLRNRGLMARLTDDAHVDRWLGCIAQRSALDILRGERRRQKRERGRTADAAPDERTDLEEQIAWLEQAMREMENQDAELLRLRSVGFTLEGVARIVGSTTGAVHGRLRRLMDGLARSAKESDHD